MRYLARFPRSGAPAALAAAFLACAFLACGKGGERTAPGAGLPCSGGRLVVLSEPPQSLDPLLSDEVYEAVVDHQIYEGLVALDAGLRLQPALATSWTISPDGLLYTFKIRPDVQFHDGSILDAATVAASLERCLSRGGMEGTLAATSLARIHGADAFLAKRAAHVHGIRVRDDRTLEIELDAPLSILLKVLAMEQTAIVSRAVSSSSDPFFAEANPIGSGPFRLVHRERSGEVCLARFDGYWGSRAFVDSLIFYSAPAGSEAGQGRGEGPPFELQALKDGRIQFAGLPSGTSAEARAAGFPVYRSPELSVSFIGLRCDLAPFDIPEVRRAALLSIRREALTAVDPEGMVPAAGLLPPGMPGRDPVNRMPKPDPLEAGRQLDQAGHPGARGLAPVALAVSRTTNPLLYEPIAADLRAIGLDVRIEHYDWRALDSLATMGGLQMFVMSWVADLPDPDAFLYPLFHSTGQSNLFGYRSARADSLLDRGRGMSPGSERNQVYVDLQEQILHDVPMIPLYHNSLAYAWNPAVKGVEIGPCGFALLSFRAVWLDPAADASAQVALR